MPEGLEAFARPPSLLPGERPEQYDALRDAIFCEIAPRCAIEWLLAIDVVELSWDIQRYRILRHKILEGYRQKAIEQALRRVDCAGILAAFETPPITMPNRMRSCCRSSLSCQLVPV
jgi:hypothetical protein